MPAATVLDHATTVRTLDRATLAALSDRLDSLLSARRASGSSKAPDIDPDDVSLAPALAATAELMLKRPLVQQEPPVIQAALHCLAAMAAWDNVARRACLGAGCVQCAVRAAAPAGPDALSLPCLLYTSPSPRDRQKSRMPSSA